ncbi:23S rRNA (adenine(2503)-C(2))-methyltransferase RlmN [Euzebya tangerina]|uniref:23S rRNA (adenine(2503)-C(2))-methyltransferase RlmN n=1 Tax=Euzebya tangerina TaxID=591198 RepID=UPI000E3200AB|nr:23S rRNA (adenine(2503)-C(2))-methyltransferase RlmN [Euzebya tangerina]
MATHTESVQPDPYTPDGLAQLLADEPAYRRDQVAEWLAKGIDDPAEMTNLSKDLRARLAEQMPARPRVLKVSESDGGLTRKVLLECGTAGAAEAVESVLMLYPATGDRSARAGSTARAGRATVCISTQAGCAMGCPFCATGQAGFRRQLTVGETVRQVTVMQRLLAGSDGAGELGSAGLPDGVPDYVTNVVFMGMGEPLANLDVTLEAVRWLHGPFGLSARSITVSTIGLVPGIVKLAELDLPITLAISLHAPDDDLRDDLVPANRQHPLAEVFGAARHYLQSTGRRVSFEYVMIDGVNTTLEQAASLRQLLATHMPSGSAHVNLIPMNPTPAVPWTAPSISDQRAFARVLDDGGISTTIRANRGNDIDAACGQLYANYQMASGRMLPAAVGAADRIAQR